MSVYCTDMNNIIFPLKCSSPAAKSSVVSSVKYTVDSVDIVDNVDSVDIVDTRDTSPSPPHVTWPGQGEAGAARVTLGCGGGIMRTRLCEL